MTALPVPRPRRAGDDARPPTPQLRTVARMLTVRSHHHSRPRPGPVPVVLRDHGLVVRDGHPSPWRPHPVLAVGLVLATLAFLLNLTPAAVVAITVGTLLGIQTTVAVDRGRVAAEHLALTPGLEQTAASVADALHEAGLSPVGAAGVRIRRQGAAQASCFLDGVDETTSSTFVLALSELVSPLASPRYVVPRQVLTRAVDNADGVKVAFGRLRAHATVWHPVPSALADTAERAHVFVRAWDRWVGGGNMVDTRTPEGARVLAAARGGDPFGCTAVLSSGTPDRTEGRPGR